MNAVKDTNATVMVIGVSDGVDIVALDTIATTPEIVLLIDAFAVMNTFVDKTEAMICTVAAKDAGKSKTC